ncbi:hypothetical protein BASA50_001167 [Batrachochytrium salamandrivorans]|uniref:NAD(P)-binding domain-containing protein n=1 Tax=Batrachochytrium salamandrivorans TaxID=1357716 RepID=A0ABQ8ES49_9FUNG|nr:hypothetical protein BASA50_001167 [Batrachochytrium salamandrivorans]
MSHRHPLEPSERVSTTHNILVTGGAGFIGSHVVIYLVKHFPTWNIFVFDKLDYCASLKSLQEVSSYPNYSFIKGDVCSAEFVNYILTDKKIDGILHLAAQSHVDNSFGDSLEFTRNNVYGTHVLLEAARVHKIRRFVHISTDEVYGEVGSEQPESHEASILSPSNPYAATKAAAECLVMAYYKSFKLPIIITRSNNIFGPFQYPEKIIPKFICSILKSRPCYIHGNGLNSRRYLFATDLAHALAIVLQHGTVGETYNIGSDNEVTNLDLTRLLLRHFNITDEQESIVFVEDRAFNDCRYAINSSKIHNLGWRPVVAFEDGLRMTAEWYRANADSWWDDDISSALAPHPKRKFPPLQFPTESCKGLEEEL